MTPYYADEWVTVYHGDCRDIVPFVDPGVLVTDPPYGIGWRPRVRRNTDLWIDVPAERPDMAAILSASRARFACVWGGNYFGDQLPPSESWLVWLKRSERFNSDIDVRSYSPVELAWTNFGGKPRTHTQNWDGGMRAGLAENRRFLHPAQKPLELMRWCVSLAPGTDVIVDPFMGSGTTLRAAKDCGRRAIGIEIEERYCAIAVERLSQEVLAL